MTQSELRIRGLLQWEFEFVKHRKSLLLPIIICKCTIFLYAQNVFISISISSWHTQLNIVNAIKNREFTCIWVYLRSSNDTIFNFFFSFSICTMWEITLHSASALIMNKLLRFLYGFTGIYLQTNLLIYKPFSGGHFVRKQWFFYER